MTNIIFYKNILSNIFSRIWAVGISFLVLPLFPSLLGFEAYGLIGFFTTLTASLMVLDLGLSSTLNRELSRSMALGVDADKVRSLVFSIECIYAVISISIGVLIFIFSPFIANNWLKVSTLNSVMVYDCIKLMGIIIAFQWPQSLYSGGLMGMQKHTKFNTANIIFSTLKNLGAFFVLKYIEQTVFAYFLFQFLITLIYTFCLRILLWKNLPKSKIKPNFSLIELKNISNFAFGMTGIGLTTLVLGQIDKFFISNKLPLDQLGIYSFGNYVGSSILIITGVIGNVLLPKLVEVVSKGNKEIITDYYHKYSRLIASLMTPIALLLCFFSKEIIFIWTGNVDTANKTHLIVSFVSFGALFNAYFTIPYYLMIAYGWTKLAIYQNIILSIIAIPLIFYSVQKFGIVGGTFLGIIGNISYVVISIPLIHHKYMPGELKKVYFNVLGPIFLISFIPLFFYKIFYPVTIDFITQFIYFMILLIIIYLFLILFTREYRNKLKSAYFKLFI